MHVHHLVRNRVAAFVLLVVVAANGAVFADEGKNEPDNEIGRRVYVYSNDRESSIFIPSGWMPDGEGIAQNVAETDHPHEGKYFQRLSCQLSSKPWVGVYHLLDGKWEPEKPFNLFTHLDASRGDHIRVRFWARSASRAIVKFKVGGVTKGEVKDSLVFPVSSKWITLMPDWTMYEIDLTDQDVSSVVGAFCWVVDQAQNGRNNVTFDLDTIYFVRVKPSK
ncbi:MAG: hypothetical protein HQ492_05095 [Woeseiaceae bacterium]|nr:hypothetical protein [Woeseiaceae bacterium]